MDSLNDSMTNAEIEQILSKFNEKNVLPIAKPSMSSVEMKNLWLKLEGLIADQNRANCYLHLLNTLRILTRDKDLVNSVLTKKMMELLLVRSGITLRSEETVRSKSKTWDVILESSKCISNVYRQSTKAIGLSFENKTLEKVFDQLELYDDHQVPLDVIEFDLRIIFLLTAMDKDAMTLARFSCNATPKLITLLRRLLRRSLNRSVGKYVCLNTQEVLTITFALKCLFNMTKDNDAHLPSHDVKIQVDDESLTQYKELSNICQLLVNVEKKEREDSELVISDVINVLSNFPVKAMSGLFAEMNTEMVSNAANKEFRFEGKIMNVPKEFIEYLFDVLQAATPRSHSKACASIRDIITPILKVLCMISAGYPAVRKYYRSVILPPIQDVTKRPEEGDSPKGTLCRLLTNPDSAISIMVAEFIFILCKENVSRMVKHTGYGNAAGLLARKGLMGAMTKDISGEYSSSDSDSETDEYSKNSHKINPITGYAEPPRPKPFEGMSEEQKEYEAVKLANLIDKLHNMGVVKPARLGEDGKPHPVDHVLELCENQAQQQLGKFNENDSD